MDTDWIVNAFLGAAFLMWQFTNYRLHRIQHALEEVARRSR